MARKKISEYRAKTLLYQSLDSVYEGISVCTSDKNWEEKISPLSPTQKFVIKVDQGVKGRGKKGLVKANLGKGEIENVIKNISAQGFSYFLIEPLIVHEDTEEKYLAFQNTRDGVSILVSDKGGVDIEENASEVKIYDKGEVSKVSKELGLNEKYLGKIIDCFESNHFAFLEINPLLVRNEKPIFLDAAVEVDTAGEFFVKGNWSADDYRDYSKRERSDEEKNIEDLASKSQASLSFTILNPDGSIFLLLSGGGASIVLADEIYNQGKGEQIANYGEYSGNPNAEETYLYTKNVIQSLLKSKATKKALIIGGGVANFTDIRYTFKGIIKALDELKAELGKNNVKVFVRRGGPHQKEGLSRMEDFLKKSNLYGQVSDQTLVLTDIVKPAIAHVL